MVTVDESEVKDFLKLASLTKGQIEPHIDTAKALIESEVGASIDERTETITINNLYVLAKDQRILLTAGPVAAITAMTLDAGTKDVTDLTVSSWSLGRPEFGFEKGLWVFTATAGWSNNGDNDDADNVPQKVRQAIIGVAAELWARPRDYKSERIADYSYTVSERETGRTALGPRAELLIREYRRPRI